MRKRVRAKCEKYRLMLEKILERPLGEIFEVSREEYQRIRRFVIDLSVVFPPEVKRRPDGSGTMDR